MPSRKLDAVVAGHICLDITPEFGKVKGKKIQEIIVPGKLLNMGPAIVSSGGPVSNTGLAMRRLGMNVALMGKRADDSFGDMLVEMVKKEAPGAEKAMASVKGEQTSYTVALAPPGIDRVFLHCTGTNDTFSSRDINPKIVKQAKLFHFGYPPLMKKMFTNGGRELTAVMKKAHATGATTSLDMALPDPASAAGKAAWKSIIKRTLPYVDLFLPSIEELMYMLDRKEYDRVRRKAGTADILDHIGPADAARVAAMCIGMGAAVVVLKCGKLGVYVRTAGKDRLEKIGRAKPKSMANWADREIWQTSYGVKRVISATGSGDSAIAGFLSAYLKGQSIESVIRYYVAVGYHNIQALDAVSGIKSWAQTTKTIKRKPWLEKVDPDLSGWKHLRKERQHLGPADSRR